MHHYQLPSSGYTELDDLTIELRQPLNDEKTPNEHQTHDRLLTTALTHHLHGLQVHADFWEIGCKKHTSYPKKSKYPTGLISLPVL